MKIETKITGVTQDDLVNLLSTALYGSYWAGANYGTDEYNELQNADDGDCFEDKLSKLLLAGKSIDIYDFTSEDSDDHYGNLPHHWDGENFTMDYEVTLNDIVKGIEKAINNGGWDAKCAMNLINSDSCDLDMPQADNILQIIVFGKAIYG